MPVENEIIPYIEMCRREGTSLQKGMNFGLGHNYSVILMSRRKNAPYKDKIESDGLTLIYEGHDIPKNSETKDPKSLDQQAVNNSGTLTENGKFDHAAQNYKAGCRSPEAVRVYEKIHQGIWSYNGLFNLIDSWKEYDGTRNVFKFKLILVDENTHQEPEQERDSERQRVIPTRVKLEVWKRDGGKCVKCGAKEELHFDHIIPYSKGGTSLKTENIQLLCAKHNIQKGDKIV